ncbi:MAG: DUF4846 domain-containing protein [Bacteroidota bacterium]|nr:DUF4846 domain-containing protein [Bacteroidota bacterium]
MRDRLIPTLVVSVSVVLSSLRLDAQGNPRRVSEIAPPQGWTRVPLDTGSFGEWLRALPLKDRPVIRAYDGTTVESPLFRVLAVVDMPLLFRRDLEQCADFCMRFWAEYHKERGRLNDLSLFTYAGKKIRFHGSGLSYTAFLRRTFSSANSFSLKRGCKAVAEHDLAPGDMIVQNERGGLGHVSLILDECRSPTGARAYLVGFSFMPAQEFHIEYAAPPYGIGGWFTMEGFVRWLSEHLDVGTPVFRRF